MDDKLICPCCGQHHFKEPDFYEVCPVCKWRDDLLQRIKPDAKGANILILNQHKAQWLKTQKSIKILHACTSLETAIIECTYSAVQNPQSANIIDWLRDASQLILGENTYDIDYVSPTPSNDKALIKLKSFGTDIITSSQIITVR